MINAILQYPRLYRFYQKTVRSNYSEYDFFKFIFSNLINEKIQIINTIKNLKFTTSIINGRRVSLLFLKTVSE